MIRYVDIYIVSSSESFNTRIAFALSNTSIINNIKRVKNLY